MNNFIKRITCSKQIDSLNENVEVNNSVDEIYNLCDTVSENTNNEIGKDNGVTDNTFSEVLSEIPDQEKEDLRKKMEDKKTRDTGKDSDDEIKIPNDDHKKIPDTKTETEMITGHVCTTETDSERTSNREIKSEINRLVFLESHYVKLGETHAYICVLEKSAVT